MDKLQPLLTHRFWVMFAVALVLPIVGWWWTTSSLEAETETNIAEWDASFAKVEQLQQEQAVSGIPNRKWLEGIEQTNQAKEREYYLQVQDLYQKQKTLRGWPIGMAEGMKKLPYRGTIEDDFSFVYRAAYERERSRVRNIVTPFDPRTQTGVVLVPEDVLPKSPDINRSELPRSDEMWDAQEDIWLTQAIMKAIAQVNSGAQKIGDARVRSISKLMFMGGYRPPLGEEPTQEQPAPDSPAAAPPGPGTMFARPGSSGTRQRGRREVLTEGAAFDPVRVFGDPKDAPSNSQAETEGAAPTTSALPGRNEIVPNRPAERRYVDGGPNSKLPYRTRGFYLEVVMEQTELPELAAALANMPWSTEILRMNMVARASDLIGANDPSAVQPGAGGPFGRSGGIAAKPTENAVVEDALAEPHLVQVAIAGLMTIYEPPAADVQSENSTAEVPPTTDDAGIPTVAPDDSDELDPQSGSESSTSDSPTADESASPLTTPLDPASSPGSTPGTNDSPPSGSVPASGTPSPGD